MEYNQKGISHNDIKDENILINPETLEIRIIDFGCATFTNHREVEKENGTTLYKPPEMIKEKYGDWELAQTWSLGILLIDMLEGDIPFLNEHQICHKELILKKK